MNTRRWTHAACAVLALCGLPGAAPAADEPRTWFKVHATHGDWRTSVNGDGPYSGLGGTLVSTDDVWGVPRRKLLPGVGFGRLIGERWRIEIDRESASRSGSTVLANDMRRGATTFLAGTRLDTQVGLAVLRLHGSWAALKTDSLQLGLLIGGQRIEISQRLEGTATYDGFQPGSPGPTPGPARATSQSDSDSTFEPLAGLFGQWQPAPNWQLHARAEGGSGKFAQLRAQAQWWPLRNVALEAGYRFMRADIDATTCFMGCSRFLASYRVRGPMLGATVAF